jgi:uncharacterized Rmd1/YagE family protein
MTREEMKWLRELITQLGKFAVDRRAFITILEEPKVQNWQPRLDELRQTPEYQVIAQRYEILARQMEVDADFEALARMLQQLNEERPPN